MKIREATMADKHAIKAMSVDFCAVLDKPMDWHFLWDVHVSLINDADACLFVAETPKGELKGMIAARLTPLFIEPGTWIASEMFWWVDPDSRAEGIGDTLVKAVELWAKSEDAAGVAMMEMHDTGSDLADYYQQHGYRPYERTYLKEF